MRKADNLPLSCAVVTKYGNLNFLEPSGPVQACNGIPLPLPTGRRIRILLLIVNKKFPHEISVLRLSSLTALYAINPETFTSLNTHHSKIVPTIVQSDYLRVVDTRQIVSGDKGTFSG